jgi:hypothetical protein
MWTYNLLHLPVTVRNPQPNTPRNRTRKNKKETGGKYQRYHSVERHPARRTKEEKEEEEEGRQEGWKPRTTTTQCCGTRKRRVESQVGTMKETLQWRKSVPQPSKTKVEYGSRTHPIKNRGNRGSRTYPTAEQE